MRLSCGYALRTYTAIKTLGRQALLACSAWEPSPWSADQWQTISVILELVGGVAIRAVVIGIKKPEA